MCVKKENNMSIEKNAITLCWSMISFRGQNRALAMFTLVSL